VKYDFDKVIDRRNTDSVKWGTVAALFGDKDVLPMWVADMDLPIARPITEALRKRTEHEVYGYMMPQSSAIEAVVSRIRKKYNWKIEPGWVVFTPGVVPALHAAILAFSQPGDEVIIQGPVYYPFWSAIRTSGRQIANNELNLIDRHYQMNFEDLEKKFSSREDGMMLLPSRIRMMVLCSPHNPVGRVWNKQELTRAGEVVLKHSAVMVSDEIHCELLFQGSVHIPFASISPEFEQSSITCMAPSKTFNLAGLNASSIIIPNRQLREKFDAARLGIQSRPNVFGLVALEAAYRYGDEWLEQLLDYLQGNLEFLIDYFARKIPQIKVIRPEGTYLVWLDCRGLGMAPQELRDFMRNKAKVGLDDGFLFGPNGAGFQRINIACPRATLSEALKRIENAVSMVR
jgi:cystathionine beta-lyase